VEAVDGDDGITEIGGDAVEVAPVRVDGHRSDAPTPCRRALGQPESHVVSTAGP